MNETDIISENVTQIITTLLPLTTSTADSFTTTFVSLETTEITTSLSQLTTETTGLSVEIMAIPSFSRHVLYISVCSISAALTLITAFIILLKVFFFPDKYIFKNPPSNSPRPSLDELPPAPNPVQYRLADYPVYQDSVSKRVSEKRSSIYAKPEIYGTFINPTFYEDAYERWRRQEAENIYTTEPIYISPRAIRPVVFNNGIYATYSPQPQPRLTLQQQPGLALQPQPRLKLHDDDNPYDDNGDAVNQDGDYIEVNQDDDDENGVEESWDDESFSERPGDNEAVPRRIIDPRISKISIFTHGDQDGYRSSGQHWQEMEDDDEVDGFEYL
ncbi:hypothetical protein LOTGIDRAFT_166184 [Lottia gigantea]|uniref:Uncharacterized protein n=1 Tax=Lottia gigantea TaxID=225164 RepID=V3ZU56_LOTGI|nr:hypothetical protein LOTGIDRAFT_166184 [Lottia gigantea]ESO87882.1 hypothetical protein LOTGIDRAFT_166184 [Lottia gigantea]